MVRLLLILIVLTLALASANALTQQPTTVQLPTLSIFSVSTTVSVPDSGGAYLGGISRSASGRVERGVPVLGKLPLAGVPFRNRAVGNTTSHSGMHVSATIIDHQGLDAAVLAQAAARRGVAPEVGVGTAVPESGASSTRDSASVGALSVAEIRRQQAAEKQSQSAEGLAYLSKADQATKEGKLGLAKVYYRLAMSRLTGEPAKEAARAVAALRVD